MIDKNRLHLLADEMEGIAWEALQKVDGPWAQAYLARFQALPLNREGIFRAEALHRELSEREHLLQMEGKIPSFDTLVAQACGALGIEVDNGLG